METKSWKSPLGPVLLLLGLACVASAFLALPLDAPILVFVAWGSCVLALVLAFCAGLRRSDRPVRPTVSGYLGVLLAVGGAILSFLQVAT